MEQATTGEIGSLRTNISDTNIRTPKTHVTETISLQKTVPVVLTAGVAETPKPHLLEKSETNDQQVQKNSNESEIADLDPVAKKKKQLKELLEQFGEHLDEDAKETMHSYLEDFLQQDEENDQETKYKLTDALAEMARLIAILAALFALMIFRQKDTYSGADLNFSDDPPEGKDNDVLNKIMFGETNSKSWKKFKEEVSTIPEMPFNKFMVRVLDANARNTVYSLKAKKTELPNRRKLEKTLRKIVSQPRVKQSRPIR